MHIDVSLDVFKALTDRLRYEGHSFDDVIRELLALDSPIEADRDAERGIEDGEPLNDVNRSFRRLMGEFYSRGLILPDGTGLRARYKGQEFQARIEGGRWIDEKGQEHSSPSSAARAITGNNVNGLRFWEARRPVDTFWRKLDSITGQSS
ncbi:DUF4357 domain-containing protein [Sphingobium sp. AR-3-1]|uniref:DUF4357 domain-containing protein n=1 Tax=Sphingobium psychrophilum TaxID=2728834 RepID=A0A7X9WV79_9SPHN|nr:DUF2924 domain-containing protein [Sphingobium psychrophilum]NML10544.1 DUF4357 domain-containing protein [Sphingobium psychrophilum]